MPAEDGSRTIARALRIIAAHPNVAGLSEAAIGTGGGWWVDVDIRLGLPNAWIADGLSPNGVRAIEPVTLIFPASFPLRAPTIWLRRDFGRSLAHVQPGDPAERPEPCIVDGRPTELLHQEGLAGILNQLVLWLENAALGSLIDPKQGWEPVRRDDVGGFVVADAAALRASVSRDAGSITCRFDFAVFTHDDSNRSVYGKVDPNRVSVNPDAVGGLLTTNKLSTPTLRVGMSLAIIAWPGKTSSGKLIITDTYQPEMVTDFGALMERAALYGCDRPLNDAVNWLKKCAAEYSLKRSYPLAVILCARRPFNVIGSDSPIEICPYVMDIGPGTLLAQDDKTPVQPVGHRHAITADLLSTLSGAGLVPMQWALIGCGSLGSKIALHLARAGRAPSTVVDNAYLSPHNAARHALIPEVSITPLNWITSKASAIAKAIQGLGQTSSDVARDVVAVLRDRAATKKHFPKKAWGIVNTTASLVVREALGSVGSDIALPRVIEASLFAKGRLGLLTIEGPDRNPNALDLMAETYSLARADDCLRGIMFEPGNNLARMAIGEGCGSPTMVMSDARVSMFAAPMAEAILQMQDGALPADDGRILVGQLAPDGLGLSWTAHAVAPVIAVGVEDTDAWSVRISRRVADAIAADIGRWPGVETGGILMGRISEAAHTFYVTDVLPAPADSVRSAHEFLLGIQGARNLISSFAESCGYSLFCLGTWHSHLVPSGASGTDRRTTSAVALARLAPSILLIHTPAGFMALLADAAGVPPVRTDQLELEE